MAHDRHAGILTWDDPHNNAAHCVSIQTWIPMYGFRATHAHRHGAVVVDFDVYESIDVARYRHTLDGARQHTRDDGIAIVTCVSCARR